MDKDSDRFNSASYNRMEAIKKWVLGFKFIQEDRESLYRKAFDDARKDLEETLVYDTDKKATELMEKRLNDMLSPVDLNNIVTLDKVHGIVYIGGIRADDLQLNNLKSEAEALTHFSLWKLIHETPKELASRAMFVDSESLDDMKKGKSILYTLSTQKKIIDTMLSYIPKK